jgi:hypothetical protein
MQKTGAGRQNGFPFLAALVDLGESGTEILKCGRSCQEKRGGKTRAIVGSTNEQACAAGSRCTRSRKDERI